ncbi:PREDICTED: uncharacterized protein LOC109211638 [Nicotiana attenuata]|uniref:Micronuclear linker histone polyprotein-like protein n=1 Tax=Nicotiana attenuata TaxID=49451 RepID=A0A314KK96_NICAT|nr:PREDICTED: uncharacterized protein LOC109211638 [Nicotiana attenuata]OIT29224.1 hypothetical protein A4A49_21456 [Nicotiana attenuata]
MRHSINTGSKGRSYGFLLLLAFSAAVFGVMTLHKLRDRRICSLFVKEKDRELNALQLLLQKEIEQAKEARRQIEDMKSNIHLLRTQKMDLDSRILEMKSTISFLKEEQRTIEAALKEKQGEIKILQEKHIETQSNDSQVTLLSETLRLKEAEIEDLKHRLELSPVKVWSVNAEDPSNPATNFTTEAAVHDGRRGSEELHESIKSEDQKNSAEDIDSSVNESAHKRNEEFTGNVDDTGKDGERFENANGKTGEEQSQQLNTSQQDVPGNSTISHINEGQKENANSYKNEKESYLDKKRYTNDNASKETEDDKNQVQNQSKEFGVNDKGVMKLEMQENSMSRGTSRVNKDHIRKKRAKRRQTIAKRQADESGMHPESRGIASMRNRKFLKVKMGTERIERAGGSTLEIMGRQKDKDMGMDVRNKPDEKVHGIEMTNKVQQGKHSEAQITNQKRPEQGVKSDRGKHRMQDVSTNHDDSPPGRTWPNPNNFADAEERTRVMNPDATQKTEEGYKRKVSNTETELLQSSREDSSISQEARNQKPDEIVQSEEIDSSISQEARNQKPDEIVQSEEITSTIREDTELGQTHNLPNSSEYATAAERGAKEDDNQEVDYYQETEEEVDHSGGLQDARNKKPDNTAQPEGINDTIREDREQKHANNLHAKTANFKVDSGQDIEEETDSTTGSAASLGEDGDNNDKPEF